MISNAGAAPNSGSRDVATRPRDYPRGRRLGHGTREVLSLPDLPKPPSVPASWHPPVPFPMQLWYGRRRRPVQLWTFPSLVDAQGRVVLYAAVGPAGQPVRESMITQIVHRPLPGRARIRILMEPGRDGQMVFAAPPHTPN